MTSSYSMRVHERGIVVFRLGKLSRQVIDLWMDDLSRLGQAWIDDETVLLMVDLRGGDFPTPYFKGRLRDVTKTTPATTHIRTAFLFDAGAPMAMATVYLQSMGHLLGVKRAFSDEDAAVGWLCEAL